MDNKFYAYLNLCIHFFCNYITFIVIIVYLSRLLWILPHLKIHQKNSAEEKKEGKNSYKNKDLTCRSKLNIYNAYVTKGTNIVDLLIKS